MRGLRRFGDLRFGHRHAVPAHGVERPWLIEALQSDRRPLLDVERASRAQHDLDRFGDENAPRLALAGDAVRRVHGRAKEIGLLPHHLAGVEADAHFDGLRGISVAQLSEGALNIDRARDGASRRRKGDHQPIAGSFDLPPFVLRHLIAHEVVAGAEHLARLLVAEAIRQFGRAHHIREQDGYSAFRQLAEVSRHRSTPSGLTIANQRCNGHYPSPASSSPEAVG